MLKLTTIFSSNRAPKAFLAAVLLFIAAETLLYINRADFVDDFWNKFIINEHVLTEIPKDYDYLIIGDSIQKTGIEANKISGGLLNLGLPGGKPMSLYLLLERYLKKHNPPKAIFLYVDPEPALDSTYVILRYFVQIPEFISIWKDLTWEERRVFIMRYWASLDLRKVGLSKRDVYKGTNRSFVERLKSNQGYMPSPRSEISLSKDFFLTNKQRSQYKISINENDMKYLDKFMALARSKNIKVVFLGFFMPKELYGILENTGFNSNYRAFYNGLKKRYPHAYFVKKPMLYIDNKYFGDHSHVNNKGADIYTRYFKSRVMEPVISKMEQK